jgi:hypothetical protein
MAVLNIRADENFIDPLEIKDFEGVSSATRTSSPRAPAHKRAGGRGCLGRFFFAGFGELARLEIFEENFEASQRWFWKVPSGVLRNVVTDLKIFQLKIFKLSFSGKIFWV